MCGFKVAVLDGVFTFANQLVQQAIGLAEVVNLRFHAERPTVQEHLDGIKESGASGLR